MYGLRPITLKTPQPPYTSPLPTSAGGPPGTLGRRPYTCITPTWTSAKCASPRWGQQPPYLPIPRRGYMCETTMARIYCCNQTLNPVTSAHIRRRHTRHAWSEAIHVHNPDVGEHRKRDSSSGSAIPYLPIPRRGYMCGTTSCMIEIEFLQQQPEL